MLMEGEGKDMMILMFREENNGNNDVVRIGM